MANKTLQLNIVSTEEEIYSGTATMLIASGKMGQLGIMPGHMPLLTTLRPGQVHIKNGDQEELFFVSGGILEVQPYVVTIMADSIERAEDIDDVAAEEARERAEAIVSGKEAAPAVSREKAMQELTEALARLQVVRELKKLRK